MQSESISELAKALIAAQAEMKGAVKTKLNPFTQSRYADLASVIDSIREPLTKNGLCWVQTFTPAENGDIPICTKLVHESGQWMESTLLMHPVKPDPQSVGSAITYGRRYALMALAGIAPEDEDDDGNAASGRNGSNPAGGQVDRKKLARKAVAAKKGKKDEHVPMPQWAFQRCSTILDIFSERNEEWQKKSVDDVWAWFESRCNGKDVFPDADALEAVLCEVIEKAG